MAAQSVPRIQISLIILYSTFQQSRMTRDCHEQQILIRQRRTQNTFLNHYLNQRWQSIKETKLQRFPPEYQASGSLRTTQRFLFLYIFNSANLHPRAQVHVSYFTGKYQHCIIFSLPRLMLHNASQYLLSWEFTPVAHEKLLENLCWCNTTCVIITC